MMRTYLYTLLLLFVINTHVSSQKAQEFNKLERIAIPHKHIKKLNGFEELHRRTALENDGLFQIPMFITPDSATKFDGNLLVQHVIKGTEISNTLFYYYSGENWRQKNYSMFALDSIRKASDLPLLKLYFHAGCCDYRYNAVAFVSSTDSLNNLLLLPLRMQSEPGSFPTIHSPDIKFTFIGDFSVLKNKKGEINKITVKYYYKNWDHLKKNKRVPNYTLNEIRNDYDKSLDIHFKINDLKVTDITSKNKEDLEIIEKIKEATNNFEMVQILSISKPFIKWMHK